MIPLMNSHQQCEALIQQMWANDVELWISRQVIREYLVQATHPNTLNVGDLKRFADKIKLISPLTQNTP